MNKIIAKVTAKLGLHEPQRVPQMPGHTFQEQLCSYGGIEIARATKSTLRAFVLEKGLIPIGCKRLRSSREKDPSRSRTNAPAVARLLACFCTPENRG